MTSKVISGLRSWQAPRLKKSTRFGSAVGQDRYKYNSYSGGVSPPLPEIVIPTFEAALNTSLDARYFGQTVSPGFFGRASDGTYIDKSNNLQVAGPSVPRFDYAGGEPIGLHMEAERTNFFLASDAPATQNVNLATGSHSVSVYGGGSILTADAGGTATGHGTATEGNPILLSVSAAGDFSFTVTPTLDYAQVEKNWPPSSIIITANEPKERARESVRWVQQLDGGQNILSNTEGMAALIWRPGFDDSQIPGGRTTTVSIMRFTFNLANGEFFWWQKNPDSTSLFANSDGTNITTALITGGPQINKDYVVAVRWGASTKTIGFKFGGSWTWSAPGTFNGGFSQDGNLRLNSFEGTYPYSTHSRAVQVWDEDRGTSWLETEYAWAAN